MDLISHPVPSESPLQQAGQAPEPLSPFAWITQPYVILVAMAGTLITLDQWTKSLILEHFQLGESIAVWTHFFNLTYVQNRGAAFGLLADADPSFREPFFKLIPLVALGSIGYVFRGLTQKDRLLVVAFSLVISGALGNFIDRLRLGFVVDFLDFHWYWGYHFPAFNVADSAICVGVALLMLDLFLGAKAKTE